jgi:glycerol dehydrogenase-like iron-containing ADH family enzyme
MSNVSNPTATSSLALCVAPASVVRGDRILAKVDYTRKGHRPLVVGGDRTLTLVKAKLQPVLEEQQLVASYASYSPDCTEASLGFLRSQLQDHQADFIIGVGGGKALDTAKLLAYQCNLPIVTIPTSAATCAAWTALSNVYSSEGAFLYDVALDRCPDLLVLDYHLIRKAPSRTLVAGIGDAIAKWYEASVSSGNSQQTLIISAVQQARILRDILFQKSADALKHPGSEIWREVVDATVLLAGLIGGIGGAQCRTVAAHAVHNGLTHVPAAHHALHGEKVAYGILVQLRLEETIQGNQLAATARQQLLKFYAEIGLPPSLEALGLDNITLKELRGAAEIACSPTSDIHRLPFKVRSEQLMAAMISTTSPVDSPKPTNPPIVPPCPPRSRERD